MAESSELESILRLYPELDTPAYRDIYNSQFIAIPSANPSHPRRLLAYAGAFAVLSAIGLSSACSRHTPTPTPIATPLVTPRPTPIQTPTPAPVITPNPTPRPTIIITSTPTPTLTPTPLPTISQIYKGVPTEIEGQLLYQLFPQAKDYFSSVTDAIVFNANPKDAQPEVVVIGEYGGGSRLMVLEGTGSKLSMKQITPVMPRLKYLEAYVKPFSNQNMSALYLRTNVIREGYKQSWEVWEWRNGKYSYNVFDSPHAGAFEQQEISYQANDEFSKVFSLITKADEVEITEGNPLPSFSLVFNQRVGGDLSPMLTSITGYGWDNLLGKPSVASVPENLKTKYALAAVSDLVDRVENDRVLDAGFKRWMMQVGMIQITDSLGPNAVEEAVNVLPAFEKNRSEIVNALTGQTKPKVSLEDYVGGLIGSKDPRVIEGSLLAASQDIYWYDSELKQMVSYAEFLNKFESNPDSVYADAYRSFKRNTGFGVSDLTMHERKLLIVTGGSTAYLVSGLNPQVGIFYVHAYQDPDGLGYLVTQIPVDVTVELIGAGQRKYDDIRAAEQKRTEMIEDQVRLGNARRITVEIVPGRPQVFYVSEDNARKVEGYIEDARKKLPQGTEDILRGAYNFYKQLKEAEYRDRIEHPNYVYLDISKQTSNRASSYLGRPVDRTALRNPSSQDYSAFKRALQDVGRNVVSDIQKRASGISSSSVRGYIDRLTRGK